MTTIAHDLMVATLDQLKDRIAILDASGLILYINQQWADFNESLASDTDMGGVNSSYIDACDAASARGALWAVSASSGIRRVLAKTLPHFEIDYQIEFSDKQQWFRLSIKPVVYSVATCYLVCHQEITQTMDARIRLSELSGTNLITGVPAKRTVDQFLTSEILRCRRQATPISMALIKTDHYQSLRNTHGVLVADECLVEIVKRLTIMAKRPSDIIGHFDDVVFVMVLGGTDITAAERIIRDVQAQAREIVALDLHGNKMNPMTLSCGLGSIVPNSTVNGDSLYDLTVAQLHRAEGQGRGSLQVAVLP